MLARVTGTEPVFQTWEARVSLVNYIRRRFSTVEIQSKARELQVLKPCEINRADGQKRLARSGIGRFHCLDYAGIA